MRKILVVLLVVLVAVPALAGPTRSDVAITATGGVSLTTGIGSPVGPMLFDMATDGSAWAKFIWFKDGLTSAGATARTDSTMIAMKIVVQLRDYTPPRSLYFPSGPDSVHVGLSSATEVILSR
jgi:hypothetical protein